MKNMENLSVGSRGCEKQVRGVISVSFKGCFNLKKWVVTAKKEAKILMSLCMDLFTCVRMCMSMRMYMYIMVLIDRKTLVL